MRAGFGPRCCGTVGIAVVTALLACETTRPASPPVVVKKPPPLSFHAELGPITALAWDDPFLWIGTARGLRRYRPGTNEELWLANDPSSDLGEPSKNPAQEPSKSPGQEPSKAARHDPGKGSPNDLSKGSHSDPSKGSRNDPSKGAIPEPSKAVAKEAGKEQSTDRWPLGQSITALAPASGPSLLVATDAGVYRVTDTGGDKPVVTPLVALPGVYRLAAVTDMTAVPEPGRNRGTPPVNPLAWLATERGLYLWDGAALHMITPAAKGAGSNAIAFLQADPDGRSAWVGLPGRGVLHVDAHGTLQTFGPAGEGAPDFTETLGMGTFANGTPFAIGRGRDGSGRLMILHKGAPALFEVDPSVRLVAVAMEQGAPLIYASKGGPLGVYKLSWVERGQSIPPDAFRFAPPHKREGERIAATPDGRTLPDDITTYAVGPQGGVFFGTTAAGVARLGVAAQGVTVPAIHLPAGELAWKARSLEVACLERDRCVIATGAGPGWIWDGADNAYKPVPTEAMGSPLMALVGEGGNGNGSGSVYFMAGDGPKGIKIARLSPDGQGWEPLLTIPVDAEGSPLISYATISPAGSLWMAVRDRLPDGQELGRGVIELQLPSGKFVYHRVTHAGQTHPPEMIPVPGDVRAVRFQSGTAAVPDAQWFCTSLGVLRAEPGKPTAKLTHWTENDGLPSDSCEDLALQDDGAVWAATREGVARWSGNKLWIPFEGAPQTAGGPVRWPTSGRGEDDPDAAPAAARAFVTVGGNLWAGTSKGIWPVTGAGKVMDQRTGLLDSDVVGLKLDRFGRLWVLGHLGLTVTDTFPLR